MWAPLSRPSLNGYIVGQTVRQLPEDRVSLLTELFVATEADAKSYDQTSAERFSSAQFGGLTNLEFETLWAILLKEEWSAEKHALSQVAETEGSWTFRFPPAYVAKLKELEPADISAAATEWAATEEISGAASDVAPVISELATLSKSVGQGQGLFVWTSL